LVLFARESLRNLFSFNFWDLNEDVAWPKQYEAKTK
jgi:hypothetical protein